MDGATQKGEGCLLSLGRSRGQGFWADRQGPGCAAWLRGREALNGIVEGLFPGFPSLSPAWGASPLPLKDRPEATAKHPGQGGRDWRGDQSSSLLTLDPIFLEHLLLANVRHSSFIPACKSAWAGFMSLFY